MVGQDKRNLWTRVAKATRMNPWARAAMLGETKPNLCIRVAKVTKVTGKRHLEK